MRDRDLTTKEKSLLLALIAGVILYALIIPLAPVLIAELPPLLVFGWLAYLERVMPQLKPDPWAVASAVACIVGVTVGTHYFLRWLAGGEWKWKRSLQGVALVVLMFVAGIAMVGMTHQTAWLIRSPEPLVQSRNYGRSQSQNNLKQMVFGALSYEDSMKTLPRSTFTATGQPLHSWQTALLPYIEQDPFYKAIDHSKPWNHPVNEQPMAKRFREFLNPAFGIDTVNDLGASHYAGNMFVVLGERKTLDSFPQGIANTIFAGEVSSGFRAWGDPLNARDPRHGTKAFSGYKGRPAQYAMLDGSVRSFDAAELAELLGKVPE